jgi:hypothetical protein
MIKLRIKISMLEWLEIIWMVIVPINFVVNSILRLITGESLLEAIHYEIIRLKNIQYDQTK